MGAKETLGICEIRVQTGFGAEINRFAVVFCLREISWVSPEHTLANRVKTLFSLDLKGVSLCCHDIFIRDSMNKFFIVGFYHVNIKDI